VSAVASTAPAGGDIAELKSEPAALESNMADSGTSVMATSEETEASYGTGKEAIIANSLDMSRQVADKEGMTPPPPIPSPVANRSDLGGNLKHTTAYAMA